MADKREPREEGEGYHIFKAINRHSYEKLMFNVQMILKELMSGCVKEHVCINYFR